MAPTLNQFIYWFNTAFIPPRNMATTFDKSLVRCCDVSGRYRFNYWRSLYYTSNQTGYGEIATSLDSWYRADLQEVNYQAQHSWTLAILTLLDGTGTAMIGSATDATRRMARACMLSILVDVVSVEP
jgi:hypothetical protein